MPFWKKTKPEPAPAEDEWIATPFSYQECPDCGYTINTSDRGPRLYRRASDTADLEYVHVPPPLDPGVNPE